MCDTPDRAHRDERADRNDRREDPPEQAEPLRILKPPGEEENVEETPSQRLHRQKIDVSGMPEAVEIEAHGDAHQERDPQCATL
jgi:hypothetical protein